VVDRVVSLQDPAWTHVFCESRLALEPFAFLILKMPFEHVLLVPGLYWIGTQPYSVIFINNISRLKAQGLLLITSQGFY